MKRETFGSRLGFILVSAGCAIGLGNVWKFPYICGTYGGAAFILIYLLFLLILGIPVLVCEFSIGRASRCSVARAFDTLEPGGRWHKLKFIGIVGGYLLMMYYTMVAGWMLYYCFRSVRGDFVGAAPAAVEAAFSGMTGNPAVMTFWMVAVCVLCLAVCACGVRKGVERVTKYMMIALLLVMVVLAVHTVRTPGAAEGVRFYLVPDLSKITEHGIGQVVFAALGQAFFTLSVGMGAMVIFASYIDRTRSLVGEAIHVTALDTFVALVAGLIVIPSCFAYGVEPDAGPRLVFVTLPNIFAQMPGGRFWGAMFFLFMSFAAVSTVIGCFESMIAFNMECLGMRRSHSVLMVAALIIPLSLPCILGFNVLSGFQPLGAGSNIMDLEDFIVSNNMIPLGALGSVLFCTRSNGWGWKNFFREANEGDGWKFPAGLRIYLSYVLPAIIMVIYVKGYYDFFSGFGRQKLAVWMCIAAAALCAIIWCVTGKITDNIAEKED